MKCPNLHEAIRYGGSLASGKWARAVLIYYDADGEVIGECLVRPVPVAGLEMQPPPAQISLPSSVPLIGDPLPQSDAT